jgi:hypothetical protein
MIGILGASFLNENHVVVFVYVFEHLDFEVEGGVEIKLIDQTHMLFLCNYDDFCYFCVIGPTFNNV